MHQSQLSPLEKSIAKKIDRTKGKASQPGYLRKLVAKLHLRIEAALARGCEYDDLAQSITETGVKISTATLKQYHTEYRRSLEKGATIFLKPLIRFCLQSNLFGKKKSVRLKLTLEIKVVTLLLCSLI